MEPANPFYSNSNRHGDWVLLDEVNLATTETLQRLCSLLDGEDGSLAITERGDVERVKRHPEFRLQVMRTNVFNSNRPFIQTVPESYKFAVEYFSSATRDLVMRPYGTD